MKKRLIASILLSLFINNGYTLAMRNEKKNTSEINVSKNDKKLTYKDLSDDILFHEILSYLPARDLYAKRWICKKWKTFLKTKFIIVDSNKISYSLEQLRSQYLKKICYPRKNIKVTLLNYDYVCKKIEQCINFIESGKPPIKIEKSNMLFEPKKLHIIQDQEMIHLFRCHLHLIIADIMDYLHKLNRKNDMALITTTTRWFLFVPNAISYIHLWINNPENPRVSLADQGLIKLLFPYLSAIPEDDSLLIKYLLRTINRTFFPARYADGPEEYFSYFSKAEIEGLSKLQKYCLRLAKLHLKYEKHRMWDTEITWLEAQEKASSTSE